MPHEIAQFPHAAQPARRLLGVAPTIHPTAQIQASQIGSWTEIGEHTTLVESTFGDYSYTADSVSIIYADVGRFCSIASHVRVNPGNHPMERVTQHHVTYRRAQYGFGQEDDATLFDRRRAARCTVGHDAWIGHAATIMPGVSIGIGAVVGAGAVVTRDVGPYEIAVGVPARVIRSRFDRATVARLLAIAWWEWDRATLEERFADLSDLPAFLAKYGR